jgi:hypothetical protein
LGKANFTYKKSTEIISAFLFIILRQLQVYLKHAVFCNENIYEALPVCNNVLACNNVLQVYDICKQQVCNAVLARDNNVSVAHGEGVFGQVMLDSKQKKK